MKFVQRFLTIAAAGLVGTALAAPAWAQSSPASPSRPESTLTLTERTEVPGGRILEPGSYIVRVVDNQSAWNVVEISSVDRSKTFATILATPHTAADRAPNTLFVFYDGPEGQPKALRSWFPPNDRWGQDFVYSKARGEQLAQMNASAKVPEATPEMETYTRTHLYTTDTAVSTETTAQNPPAMTTTTTTERTVDTTDRTQLPKTASPYPLLALAGVSALGLGLAVRRLTV